MTRTAADWLALAAAPSFALMALFSATRGSGPAELLCAAAGGAPLTGMATMYALMSLFHAGPWIRRFSAQGKSVRRAAGSL